MVLFGADKMDSSFCGKCVIFGRWRLLDRNSTYRFRKGVRVFIRGLSGAGPGNQIQRVRATLVVASDVDHFLEHGLFEELAVHERCNTRISLIPVFPIRQPNLNTRTH